MSSTDTITYNEFGNLLDLKLGTILDKKLGSLLDMKLSTIEETITQKLGAAIKREVNSAVDILKSDFTQTTDFIVAEHNDLKKNFEIVNKQIEQLEANKIKLNLTVSKLEKRLGAMEKVSRSLNVEIQAVPEKNNENVLTIVRKLYETLNLTISDSEISAVRRVAKMDRSSPRPRNILLTLPSGRHCDILLAAVRKFNKDNSADPLNSVHLGIMGNKSKIYVVEHLSPEVKGLYAAARKIAKSRGYTYVWAKYGRIYVRKSENESVIHIKNTDCLEKLE